MPSAFGFGLDLSLTTGAAASATYLPTVSAAPYMAFGSKKLISAYGGKALKHDAAGGTDIAFVGQDLDEAALISLGAGRVMTFYDQAGSSRDLTQGTAATRPAITAGLKINGTIPVIIDGNSPGFILRGLNIASGLSISTQAVTVFTVAAPMASYMSNQHWNFMRGGVAPGYALRTANPTPGYSGFGSTTIPRSQNSVVAYRGGAANQKLWIKGITSTAAAQAVDTIIGFYLGAESVYASAFSYSHHLATVIYNVALSDADVQLVIDALTSLFNVPTTFTKRLVGDGDSIWQGYLEQYLQTSSFDLNVPGLEVYNIAIAGSTAAQRYTDRANCRDILYTAAYGAGKCIFLHQAGTNDVTAGTTGANIYANSTTPYVSSALALGAGASTLVATLIDQPANRAIIDAYNTLVRGNSAGSSAVTDPGSDSIMGVAGGNGNATYFAGDSLHVTAAGAARLASSFYTPSVLAL